MLVYVLDVDHCSSAVFFFNCGSLIGYLESLSTRQDNAMGGINLMGQINIELAYIVQHVVHWPKSPSWFIYSWLVRPCLHGKESFS